MFGSHLSIAGSMLNALDEAVNLGLDTVQVFTKNQQQWKAKPLDAGMVRDWRARIVELGWAPRTVSHASYLINLASPDDELWRKSIDLMSDEIERCETLGIPFLVHHPGAFTTSSREAGLSRIARAYAELFERSAGYRTVLCLENTVGGGSNLGREFAELAELRRMILDTVGDPARVGYCFDTCHAHAGGYDLSAAESAAAVFAEWDRACGLENIRVLHLNDSKTPLNSRRDRHEHIGMGSIGLRGFAAVLSVPWFAERPKILETPKGLDETGTEWDRVNLARLKGCRVRNACGDPEPPRRPGRSSGPAKSPKPANKTGDARSAKSVGARSKKPPTVRARRSRGAR